MNSYSESYKDAGVDITAGYKAVELMKQHIDVYKRQACKFVPPPDTSTAILANISLSLHHRRYALLYRLPAHFPVKLSGLCLHRFYRQ